MAAAEPMDAVLASLSDSVESISQLAARGLVRFNPEDKHIFSLAGLIATCGEQYSDSEIRAYWDSSCQRIVDPFAGRAGLQVCVTSGQQVSAAAPATSAAAAVDSDIGSSVVFVSLGSWCGVRMASTSAGVDGPSLPFDWVRISLEGILHALSTDFEEFLRREEVTADRHFIAAHHSFFHHDLDSPEDLEAYRRRFERFRALGSTCAADGQTPLFVRAASSSLELRQLPTLLEHLLGRCPDAKLLFILDHQPSDLAIFADDCPKLMLRFLGDDRGHAESYSVERPPFVQAYHEALHEARLWATAGNRPLEHVQLNSLSELLRPPAELAPRPRALLRHVSLCEDLSKPFCYDAQMPPEAFLALAVSADGEGERPFVREMVQSHLLALLRLHHEDALICRRSPPLRSAAALEAAIGATAEGKVLEPALDMFFDIVRTSGVEGLRNSWASFWAAALLPLVGDAAGGAVTDAPRIPSTNGRNAPEMRLELNGSAAMLRSTGGEVGEELRRSPEDGRVYNFVEFVATCGDYYSDAETQQYWENECVPVQSRDAL